MAKKRKAKDLLEAVKELREEEQLPLFNKPQLETFNSAYVGSYDKALAVLDEKENLHAKTKAGKSQSF